VACAALCKGDESLDPASTAGEPYPAPQADLTPGCGRLLAHRSLPLVPFVPTVEVSFCAEFLAEPFSLTPF